MRHFVVGFQGKAYKQLIGAFLGTECGSDVDGAGKRKGEVVFGFFDFLGCVSRRTVIGNGSSQNGGVGRGEKGSACLKHVMGRLHRMNAYTLVSGRAEVGRAQHEIHVGTFISECFGDGDAHFATGLVADEAHRV